MDNGQVDSAFTALHEAEKQARLLYMDLRDAGNTTDATTAEKKADGLQNQIDQLLVKQLSDWQDGAEALIPQLSDAADATEKAVDEVSQDVTIAQNVANAMQSLDKVASLALKFIG